MPHSIDVVACVDSRMTFNIITMKSNAAERRLQTDVFAARESYTGSELKQVRWITGTENGAYILSKELCPNKQQYRG